MYHHDLRSEQSRSQFYTYSRGPTLVRSTLVRAPSLVVKITLSSHFSAVPALKWDRNASTSLRSAGRDDGRDDGEGFRLGRIGG